MQKEQLFFWPLCLNSYAPGEGNDSQFPFPQYENGDIFLSWGALGVAAYASYKPEIALRYVKNVLAQYKKDGLAFQRYGREKQEGLGDDILAGNSLSIIGLYQAIYGINPRYNRFYLTPRLTKELDGTRLKYNFRGKKLTIALNMNNYSVSDDWFTITAKTDFGFYSAPNELLYFNGAKPEAAMKVETSPSSGKLALAIKTWGRDRIDWDQSWSDGNANDLVYHFSELSPNSHYAIFANGKMLKRKNSDTGGRLQFEYSTGYSTGNDARLSLIRVAPL